MSETTMTIPTAEWKQIKRDWRQIKKNTDLLLKMNEANSYINESQVCELLGISKKTLSNYISSEKIPANYYTVGVGGNRFYNRDKIMGLT